MKNESELKENLKKEEVRLRLQSKFIKEALFLARPIFKDFEEGYRKFSLDGSKYNGNISEKALSDIAIEISKEYNCENINILTNNPSSDKKEYFFEFIK